MICFAVCVPNSVGVMLLGRLQAPFNVASC